MKETIIETRTCRACSTPFSITDRDMEFYTKVSPIFNGKKELIPPPTMCPECRQQRRLAFRNERKLYKRKCDMTGKDIISIYSPNKSYKVYHESIWWSDAWDPLSYGQTFDGSQSFFEQFGNLVRRVPHLHRHVHQAAGSDYVNGAAYVKNSYLCFNADFLEDCLYCASAMHLKACVDCSFVNKLENSYACYNTNSSYGLLYCDYSQDCANSSFLSNCKNCHDCFFCVNLVSKRYHIKNREYTPEEYHAKVSSLCAWKTMSELHTEFIAFSRRFPKRHLILSQTSDVVGDNVEQAKDCYQVFEAMNIENCKYTYYLYNAKDCMDHDIYGDTSELIYESIMTGTNSYQSAFCCANWLGSSRVYYSMLVSGCKDCFGCMGLKNKQYCILNKQYTKDEYETLVPKIIASMREAGEWGEFFSPSISPFGYNETFADEFFPSTQASALAQGFNWSDYEPPAPQVSKTIPADRLPDHIEDIPDDILNWAIVCEVSGKPFRIVKAELDFYRKHKLPIPRRHPDQRHLDRMALRNPRKLFNRKCDTCWVDMQTTYAPDRPEIVYCEQCYRQEIYG